MKVLDKVQSEMSPTSTEDARGLVVIDVIVPSAEGDRHHDSELEDNAEELEAAIQALSEEIKKRLESDVSAS